MGPTVCEGKGRKAHALSKFFRFEDMGYEYQWQFCNFSAQTGPTAVCTVPSLPKLQRIFFFLFFFISFPSFQIFYSIFAALFPATFSLPPLTFVLFHFYLKIMMKPKLSQCGREPICAHVLLLTGETQDLHRQAVTPLVPLCRSSPR